MELTRQALKLLPLEEMREGVRIPSWLNREYEIFRKVVLDPAFPCFFGTFGEKNGELRYTYAEEGVWRDLPRTLRTFLALSREHPSVRHALVLFVEPAPRERSLAEYGEQFWSILHFLHEADAAPWPLHRPEDPEHPLWEFCFDGEPMFVFASESAVTWAARWSPLPTPAGLRRYQGRDESRHPRP